MYKRILLAYDGTREGLVALREGGLLARMCGAQVFLLSVISQKALGVITADGGYVDQSSRQLEETRAILQRGVDVAREFGLDPVAKMVIGEPAPQIGAYAEEIDADLVVLGSRPKGFLQRWWSGSTGAYVSDHVRCSVLLGRMAVSDEEMEAERHALTEAG